MQLTLFLLTYLEFTWRGWWEDCVRRTPQRPHTEIQERDPCLQFSPWFSKGALPSSWRYEHAWLHMLEVLSVHATTRFLCDWYTHLDKKRKKTEKKNEKKEKRKQTCYFCNVGNERGTGLGDRLGIGDRGYRLRLGDRLGIRDRG